MSWKAIKYGEGFFRFHPLETSCTQNPAYFNQLFKYDLLVHVPQVSCEVNYCTMPLYTAASIDQVRNLI